MHISCVSYKTNKYNSDYKSFFRHVKYDQLKSVMIYISFFPPEMLWVEPVYNIPYHSNELAVSFASRTVIPLMVL